MESNGLVVPEAEPAPTKKAKKEAVGFAEGNSRLYDSVRTHIHVAGLFLFWTLVAVVAVLSSFGLGTLALPRGYGF